MIPFPSRNGATTRTLGHRASALIATTARAIWSLATTRQSLSPLARDLALRYTYTDEPSTTCCRCHPGPDHAIDRFDPSAAPVLCYASPTSGRSAPLPRQGLGAARPRDLQSARGGQPRDGAASKSLAAPPVRDVALPLAAPARGARGPGGSRRLQAASLNAPTSRGREAASGRLLAERTMLRLVETRRHRQYCVRARGRRQVLKCASCRPHASRDRRQSAYPMHCRDCCAGRASAGDCCSCRLILSR